VVPWSEVDRLLVFGERVKDEATGRETDAHDGGGLGLGLTICRQLVEARGEKLWVRSSPGEGTTFYLTLHALRAAADVARGHHP
jgi:signal transduction histidine kinase